jgi:hypothetical protein
LTDPEPLDGKLALASHWVVTPEIMLVLNTSEKEFLLTLGCYALGLGILIYLVVFRPDAADRKRLENGSAEPADEPAPITWGSLAFGCAFGCFRVIVYLIIIIAVVMGGLMLYGWLTASSR